MSLARAFLGLGSTHPQAATLLEGALRGLEAAGVRVAAVAAPVSGPFVGPGGSVLAGAPPVLNSVAEVLTPLGPGALLELCLRLEQEAGRVRDGSAARSLDLDVLAVGEEVRAGPPALPHPRALERAFVLGPWEEVAPFAPVAGTGATVLAHAMRLRARAPQAFAALQPAARLALPALGRRVQVLDDAQALAAWRERQAGSVGVVPTMGALHAGHAALVRRARAESDAVLATIFVNPLQFGPHEDFARYPRTFESDLAVLSEAGADAVYVPTAEDLYAPGFASYVVPEGPALGLEGERRPGHFRGVATVVLKLLLRARAQRAWFGRKDAQQVAVVQRMVRDLDLPVQVVVGPTVKDDDGLALSSRNRYLAPAERAAARALPRALDALQAAAAAGQHDVAALVALGRQGLEAAGLGVDYLAVVDPASFAPQARLGPQPSLAVATVRCGSTRLLDNRWLLGA
ncbi:MAG: pantoate--beta-alanine ligase [Planctomycetia bacterium]